MKTRYTVALSMIAGVALGGVPSVNLCRRTVCARAQHRRAGGHPRHWGRASVPPEPPELIAAPALLAHGEAVGALLLKV